MSTPRFIHLRVHSAYSLLEGALHAKKLPILAERLEMPAIAICDTNNLFGALEFAETAAGVGIQPIMGLQLAVRYGETLPGETPLAPCPVALYAQDNRGWSNLMALSSAAYLDTDTGEDPHVPLGVLEAHAEGVICLTGGARGPLGTLIRKNKATMAADLATRFSAAFPGRLYIELQRHGSEGTLRTPEEDATEAGLIDIAYVQNLPLVATNDVYFEGPEMVQAHDAFLCIGESRYVNESDRRMLTPEHDPKTQSERIERFSDLPE
ncbi:MAG: PHP domain-containing protein, partial [Pseudomonadota bacterium]